MAQLSTHDVLTVRECAQILRVSPWTIRRRIADGELRAHRVGAAYRVQRGDLEALRRPAQPRSTKALRAVAAPILALALVVGLAACGGPNLTGKASTAAPGPQPSSKGVPLLMNALQAPADRGYAGAMLTVTGVTDLSAMATGVGYADEQWSTWRDAVTGDFIGEPTFGDTSTIWSTTSNEVGLHWCTDGTSRDGGITQSVEPSCFRAELDPDKDPMTVLGAESSSRDRATPAEATISARQSNWYQLDQAEQAVARFDLAGDLVKSAVPGTGTVFEPLKIVKSAVNASVYYFTVPGSLNIYTATLDWFTP